MTITLLGTGTCQIDVERAASSVLVELPNLRLVFDFGRGIGEKLAGRGLKSDDVEHIVLSHFHPDHVSDLIPFLHAASWSRADPRSKDLHIYGPRGVEVQVMRILSLFGPDELTRPHFKVVVHEVREEKFTIEEYSFQFCDLPPANNHGLKFSSRGVTYALTGDSYYHQQEIDFLTGVDVAVFDAGHITPEEIVSLAVGTQASRMYCSHLYQPLEIDELNSRARTKGFSGELLLAHDGLKIA